MDMERMVGKRLAIMTQDGGASLGWGTYVWNGEILLDIGKKINEKDCHWEEAIRAPKVPPFEFVLAEDIRIFFFDGARLINQGDWIPKGSNGVIEKIEKKPWNHGDYLAGQFMTKWYNLRWLLISELQIEDQMKGYLHVVK